MSDTFFQASKTSMNMELCTVIVGIVQVIATCISAAIVDKMGRKILLLLSGSFMALCTILLGVYFSMMAKNESSVKNFTWLPLVSLIFFIIMFSLGYGPVPWVMMGELFDPSFKSLACGINATTNWIIAFIITKAYAPMNKAIGGGPVFWIFSGLTILGLFFVIFAMTETKGKSLAEIQESSKSKKDRKAQEVVEEVPVEKPRRKYFYFF